MIPFVLAVALAGSFTPETACVEHDLQLMLSAPAKQSTPNRAEIDRRIMDVLRGERAVEASAAPQPRAWVTEVLAPSALAFVGLVLVVMAVGRRSRAMALAGMVALVGAAALSFVPLRRARDFQTRIADIRTCRLRLGEVKAMLLQGDYGRCLDDIGEADEDLMVYEAALKSDRPVTADQIAKVRREMMHRP